MHMCAGNILALPARYKIVVLRLCLYASSLTSFLLPINKEHDYTWLRDYDIHSTQIINPSKCEFYYHFSPLSDVYLTSICDVGTKRRLSTLMSYLLLLDVLDTVLYRETMNSLVLTYLFVSLRPDWSN